MLQVIPIYEIQSYSASTTITYGFVSMKLGTWCIGIIQDAVSHLSCWDSESSEALQQLQAQWPAAPLQRDDVIAAQWIAKIFASSSQESISIIMQGTPFQQRVWQALLTISPGATVSYEDVANMLEKPTAVRAVASAIARNNIAYLIPCHRVIRKSGAVHKYRWGRARKIALLVQEQAAIKLA